MEIRKHYTDYSAPGDSTDITEYTGMFIYYFSIENKYPWKITYFKDGKFHRIDGPASIHFNALSGAIAQKYFWIDGKQFGDKFEWFDALLEEQKIQALFNSNEWR